MNVAGALAWGRSHRSLSVVILVALLALLGVIISLARTIAPGSFIGITFGIAAALAMFVVMLYSIRRSMPANRKLGPSRTYLRLHIWVGLAFILLVLLHSEFRIPRAGFNIILWAVSLWVGFSGIVGVILQRTLPRIMEPAAAVEVNLGRIPQFVDELRERADEIARGAEARARAYYEQRLAPDMQAPRMLTSVLTGSSGASTVRGEIATLRRTLTDEGAAALDTITALHATKHDLDVHYTLQKLLRGWLSLHLPVAITLIVLVLLHIFLILYF